MFKYIKRTFMMILSVLFLQTASGFCSGPQEEVLEGHQQNHPSISFQQFPVELHYQIFGKLPIGTGIQLMLTCKDLNTTFQNDLKLWERYVKRISGHQLYKIPTLDSYPAEELAKKRKEIINDLHQKKFFVFQKGMQLNVEFTGISGDGTMLVGYKVRGDNLGEPLALVLENGSKVNQIHLPKLPSSEEDEADGIYIPCKISENGKVIIGEKSSYDRGKHPLAVIWYSGKGNDYSINKLIVDPNRKEHFTITDVNSEGTMLIGFYKVQGTFSYDFPLRLEGQPFPETMPFYLMVERQADLSNPYALSRKLEYIKGEHGELIIPQFMSEDGSTMNVLSYKQHQRNPQKKIFDRATRTFTLPQITDAMLPQSLFADCFKLKINEKANISIILNTREFSQNQEGKDQQEINTFLASVLPKDFKILSVAYRSKGGTSIIGYGEIIEKRESKNLQDLLADWQKKVSESGWFFAFIPRESDFERERLFLQKKG